jgi:uracil-DNA glycosylase family 4
MRCPHIDVVVNRVFQHFLMGGPHNLMIADSYLHWWTLSGVENLVGETPAGWLDAPAVNDNAPKRRAAQLQPAELPPLPEVLIKKEAQDEQKTKAPAVFPDDWDAFQSWLGESPDVPGADWDNRRILPQGNRQSKLMVITAWPEMEDHRAGHLFSGDAGLLFDRMLKAVGLTIDDCYIASLATTRPAGGRCQEGDLPELQRLLDHHIRLAAPERLLLIGGDITRVMLQKALQTTRGKISEIHNGDQLLQAVTIPHPSLLLARPSYKAAAWDSLKLLIQRD